mmetsp:Transcript_8611/g.26418  ORF Transcript_8611/g.26418 Transcript_8611/m.26418 type:complete len:202 (+) Transcript_8611:1832-2437(+)
MSSESTGTSQEQWRAKVSESRPLTTLRASRASGVAALARLVGGDRLWATVGFLVVGAATCFSDSEYSCSRSRQSSRSRGSAIARSALSERSAFRQPRAAPPASTRCATKSGGESPMSLASQNAKRSTPSASKVRANVRDSVSAASIVSRLRSSMAPWSAAATTTASQSGKSRSDATKRAIVGARGNLSASLLAVSALLDSS